MGLISVRFKGGAINDYRVTGIILTPGNMGKDCMGNGSILMKKAIYWNAAVINAIIIYAVSICMMKKKLLKRIP